VRRQGRIEIHIDATIQRLEPLDQARIHCLQALGMAGHIANQEAQELVEQRVVSFRACSADKHHLAAGENAVEDPGALAELKGARHGLRHGGLVAVERLLNVDSTLGLAGTARSGKGVDVCMAMQAPCLVNVIALPVIAEQQL
jgi:hypothetical protein